LKQREKKRNSYHKSKNFITTVILDSQDYHHLDC